MLFVQLNLTKKCPQQIILQMFDLGLVGKGGFGGGVKEFSSLGAAQLLRSISPLIKIDSASTDLLVNFYSTRLTEVGYSSGSIAKYENDGLPVSQLVNSAFEKHQRAVKILDVGCADGEAIGEIDSIFPSRAQSYGVTLGGFRSALQGRVFRGPCELLPAACAGKFDLIFSLWSFGCIAFRTSRYWQSVRR